MSVFSPEQFEQMTIDQSFETEWTPIPEGDYIAFIEDIKFNQFEGRDGRNYFVLNVTYNIQDENLQKELGLDSVRVRDSIFLDVNEDGSLAVGPNKNVRLGQLRAAVGQNKPGEVWSPGMLRGAGPVKVHVTISEPNEEGKTYNRVRSITAAA